MFWMHPRLAQLASIQDKLNKEPVDVKDINGEWHKFSNTVYNVLGSPSHKHQDWFDDQDAYIQNLLETKLAI